MEPKGKGGRVKVKHSISFLQYLLSAPGKKRKTYHHHKCLRVTQKG